MAAALWNRAGHYIFVLWFLLSIFYLLLFSLAYSQPSQIGCLPYFHTWCGLSANLGCRSETCCMRLAEYTGHKKLPKNRHLRTIAQLCRAMSSQLRHVSTVGFLYSNIHMSAQYGELRPTSASVRLFGAPQQISTGFASWLRYCSDVVQWKPSKLCTMFGRLLGWYTIYIFGGSCPITEFC